MWEGFAIQSRRLVMGRIRRHVPAIARGKASRLADAQLARLATLPPALGAPGSAVTCRLRFLGCDGYSYA